MQDDNLGQGLIKVSATRTSGKLSEFALEAIRARIVDGSLALGEAISETSLAADLNVSKTPVREALQELKREGLVQIIAKRGTFVFEASGKLVRELSDFRLIVELAALERAMNGSWGRLVDHCEPIVTAMDDALTADTPLQYRRLDAEFHRGIVAHCANDFLKDAYASIEFRVQALRTRLSTAPENNNRTLREHHELLEAIIGRDTSRALEILSRHISETRETYLAHLENKEAKR